MACSPGGALPSAALRPPLRPPSREFCPRSHQRYTLCGHHGAEETCAKGLDWRLCPGCVGPTSGIGVADRLWRGLNSYNFCPLLVKDVPKHSLLDTCSTCKTYFMPGLESYSIAAFAGLECDSCTKKRMEQDPLSMRARGTQLVNAPALK